nr:hypothetical protein GCM10025699_64260 [Microbacterium flavescens]
MPQLDDHQLEGVRGWLIGLVHEHRLSPTQRRVVQHMLDSMPQVAFASTIDMAEAAGVSQPTVTRIATALGFSGYAEFRNAARDAVLSATPPPAASTTGPPPTTPGPRSPTNVRTSAPWRRPSRPTRCVAPST